MLLQKWVEFFNNAALSHEQNLWLQSPSSYIPTAIRYLINLDAEGNIWGSYATSSGRKKDRGKYYAAPHVLVRQVSKPSCWWAIASMFWGGRGDPQERLDENSRCQTPSSLCRKRCEICAQETAKPSRARQF